MKKHLVLTVGLAVLSTSAFATKARMEALGENANRGALFVQDNRNIFRNAAQVNSMKNYVVTEWGTAVTLTAAPEAPTADSSTAPKAEGGFFREAGAFSYGVYLGSDINDNSAQRNGKTAAQYVFNNALTTVTTGETEFLDAGNKLDLFFAGDAGVVEWGARLGYARNNDKNGIAGSSNGSKFDRTATAMQLGLGVVFGDLQAYTNLDLMNEAKGASLAGDKWDSDLGVNVGANYQFMGWTAWVDYDKQGAEYSNAEFTTIKPLWEQTSWNVGLGKSHEVSSGARVLTSVRYHSMATSYDKLNTGVAATSTAQFKGKTSQKTVPLAFGFEADATSWLTLRGSVSQNINFLSAKNGNPDGASATTVDSGTETASTDVNAGATLNFGKLKVDGTIGTTDSNRAGNIGAEKGVLALDNLMSRVAVHYWF